MANEPKKYVITMSPSNARKSRFHHRSFNTKKEAEDRLKKILKTPSKKRDIINPRVSKNVFFKK